MMKISIIACLLAVALAGCSHPSAPSASPYPSATVPAGVPPTTAKNMQQMPPELRSRIPGQDTGARRP